MANLRSEPSDLVEISCDESGSDGENLIDGRHRVFAHGSVDFELEEAREVVEALRQDLRVQSRELKCSEILKRNGLDDMTALFESGGLLFGRGHIFLVDKLYLAVSKTIDLIVEEEAHYRDLDLYADGLARHLAMTLFQKGPSALGEECWSELLGAFVSLVRRRQRKGSKATVEDFFLAISRATRTVSDPEVRLVLDLVWRSRGHAEAYGRLGSLSRDTPNLDPIVAALMPVSDYWSSRHSAPVALVHDRQSILTSELVSTLIVFANNPYPGLPATRVPLKMISQVDSIDDPRVQLADLTAGLGRRVGELALANQLPQDLVATVGPLVDDYSLWGDPGSWSTLTGGRSSARGQE